MKKYKGFLSKVAKSGFYIILFLCISAIGISGYVMFLAKDAVKDTETAIDVKSSFEIPFPSDRSTSYNFGQKVEEPKGEEKIPPKPEPEKNVTTQKTDEKTVPTIAETKKAEPKPEKTEYTMAVSGAISAPFSGKELVKSETMGDWRIHSGVDIASEMGTPVLAIADGVVSQVATDTMMGSIIKIRHEGGIESIYANLEEGTNLKVGDKLKAGDAVGKIGATALAECLEKPHLHLEVLKNGEHIDPLSLFPAGEE